MRTLIALGLATLLGACAMTPAPTGDSDSSSAVTSKSTAPFSALEKHKAELLTSIWENGTTVLQYGYCENIKDGRGYTSGRAGFCSGTGDAVLVVQCVAKSAPTANMAKYAPALVSITNTFDSTGNDQGDTSTLDALGSYCADWSADAADPTTGPLFQDCQDQVVSQLYFSPALAEASKYGLTQALTIAALYDAEINHGDDGENGVADLAKQTNAKVGAVSGARTLAQESTWLKAFLQIRANLLKSDSTWEDAEDRVANYEALREAANWDLSKPITTTAKATKIYGAGFKDSGYPACSIAADGTVSGDAACTDAHPSGDDDDDDTSSTTATTPAPKTAAAAPSGDDDDN